MANILILGGGFGGLIAAEKLSAALGGEHRVTLVSQTAKFTFYPALVHLAFGKFEPDDITFDLSERLRELNVRFVEGEVIDIKPNLRRVQVAGKDFNGDVSYDYLIIALGRRLATEKVRGFFEHSNHLLGTKAALDFGAEVERFEKGNIVVGMSPQALLPVPVCETAFELANKFAPQLKNNEISVSVVFPESIESAFGGADLHRELTEAFEKHGIKVKTFFPVGEISDENLIGLDGRKIPYDLLMLLPSFRGQSFLNKLHISDEFDFIKVDEMMRVPDLPGVYAVGDVVNFAGPKLAHMAVRQAHIAAANILAEIKGGEPREVYYHEIAAIIDAGGADSIYLHYGIWDESLYRLKKGRIWSWAKRIHDKLWTSVHEA